LSARLVEFAKAWRTLPGRRDPQQAIRTAQTARATGFSGQNPLELARCRTFFANGDYWHANRSGPATLASKDAGYQRIIRHRVNNREGYRDAGTAFIGGDLAIWRRAIVWLDRGTVRAI